MTESCRIVRKQSGGKKSKGTSAAAHKKLLPPEKNGDLKAGLGRSVRAVPRPEKVISMTEGEFKDF